MRISIRGIVPRRLLLSPLHSLLPHASLVRLVAHPSGPVADRDVATPLGAWNSLKPRSLLRHLLSLYQRRSKTAIRPSCYLLSTLWPLGGQAGEVKRAGEGKGRCDERV